MFAGSLSLVAKLGKHLASGGVPDYRETAWKAMYTCGSHLQQALIDAELELLVLEALHVTGNPYCMGNVAVATTRAGPSSSSRARGGHRR